MTKTARIVEILAFAMIVLMCPSWLFKGIILGLFIAYRLIE